METEKAMADDGYTESGLGSVLKKGDVRISILHNSSRYYDKEFSLR